MGRIRSKDTKPEMVVRRLAHGLGFRYRLHGKHLPGSPDLVFPGKRKVIFVHGCFWHRHAGCRLAAEPRARREFWKKKFRQNVARDQRTELELEQNSWKVLVIWECETRSPEEVARRLVEFLKR